jgi:nitrate/nitrite transport system ATP-binding protein
MTRPFLSIEGLAKRFPPQDKGDEPLTVFENVTFGFEKGELVCIIGHSAIRAAASPRS